MYKNYFRFISKNYKEGKVGILSNGNFENYNRQFKRVYVNNYNFKYREIR